MKEGGRRFKWKKRQDDQSCGEGVEKENYREESTKREKEKVV